MIYHISLSRTMLNLHMTSSSPLEFLWILCLRSHADAKAYDRNGRITALVKLGQRPGGRGWEGWTTLTVEIVEVVPKKTQNQRKLVEFSSIKFSIFCETCPNTSFRGASQHGKIEDVNVAVDAVGGEAGCLSFGTHRTTLHQNLKIMKLIYHNMFNLRMMLDRQRIKTQNNMYIYIYTSVYNHLSILIRIFVIDSGYQLTKIWPRYMEPGICFPKLWQSYRTQLRKGQEDSGASIYKKKTKAKG